MNERMEIPIQDISYEKYLWSLITEINHNQIIKEIIGNERSERTGMVYPIYRLVINPQASKRICIISGVHGNEIAGPLSLLNLLKQAHRYLPPIFQYVIYPVLNPTGFDLRQRFDDDYRDLNAVYKTTLESKNYREVQTIYADLEKYQPFDAVITLHEDLDVEQFYMYGLGEQNVPFYHGICDFAHHYCDPWKNADIYGCESDDMGLILASAMDHAFDGYLFSKGLTPIACTIETPGKLDISFRT